VAELDEVQTSHFASKLPDHRGFAKGVWIFQLSTFNCIVPLS
jgi:hypothetical protein